MSLTSPATSSGNFYSYSDHSTSTSSKRVKKNEVIIRKGKNGNISYRYIPNSTVPIEANYISRESKERYDRLKIVAQCICHRKLVQRILKSECLFCDKCEEIIEMDEIIWSCPRGNKSHKHENGYDICNKCCLQLIVKQFQQQTRIPNYNHYDDDRLPSSGECGISCCIMSQNRYFHILAINCCKG